MKKAALGTGRLRLQALTGSSKPASARSRSGRHSSRWRRKPPRRCPTGPPRRPTWKVSMSWKVSFLSGTGCEVLQNQGDQGGRHTASSSTCSHAGSGETGRSRIPPLPAKAGSDDGNDTEGARHATQAATGHTALSGQTAPQHTLWLARQAPAAGWTTIKRAIAKAARRASMPGL